MRGAVVTIGFLLVQSLSASPVETVFVSAVVERGVVTVSAALERVDPEPTISSLQEGFKSEISFQLRLYQRKSGFFSFLGDRLILEKTINRLAHRDIFQERFVLETSGGKPLVFDQQDRFLRAFFRLEAYPLIELTGEEWDQCYVLARIRLKPVRIVPPLNIIALFSRAAALTTPWTECVLNLP